MYLTHVNTRAYYHEKYIVKQRKISEKGGFVFHFLDVYNVWLNKGKIARFSHMLLYSFP